MTNLNEIKRILLAAGASLLFSFTCLTAALDPSRIDCAGAAVLLDCPARL